MTEKSLRERALAAHESWERFQQINATRLLKKVLGVHTTHADWARRGGGLETSAEGVTFVILDSQPETLLAVDPAGDDISEVTSLASLGKFIASWPKDLAGDGDPTFGAGEQ